MLSLIRMKLQIKYMVSNCCKKLVRTELDKLGLRHIAVDLGEVELKEPIASEQRAQLKIALLKAGFELMDDQRAILIEKIKNVIIEMVHYTQEQPKINSSDYLVEKLGYDYTYLSNLFSEMTGITIENYIIAHKIERIKELLLYNELTLTQIAHQLHYSSVAYLSAQFKKVTGLTPTYFKKLKQHKKRISLEDV